MINSGRIPPRKRQQRAEAIVAGDQFRWHSPDAWPASAKAAQLLERAEDQNKTSTVSRPATTRQCAPLHTPLSTRWASSQASSRESRERWLSIAEKQVRPGSPGRVRGRGVGSFRQEHLADLLVAVADLLVAVASRLVHRRVPGGWPDSAFAAAPHQSSIIAGKVRMIDS